MYGRTPNSHQNFKFHGSSSSSSSRRCPIPRGPRYHPPLEIIDSVLLLEEADDFAAPSRHVARGPCHHPPPEFIGSIFPHVDIPRISSHSKRDPPSSAAAPWPVVPLDQDVTIRPLLSAGYFTYVGHQDFIPPREENYYYYYPAMPSTSGINNGDQETSNLEWVHVEEEEETMILGGSRDDRVMCGGLSKKIIGELLENEEAVSGG
ncbi:hypothetical protein DH2020_042490 [Rehmannia glutinosa]|uniref:Uncharacterized protein n=1 Tax=Rehmannia glutinosa TaxID=99300 RepID=A0ABR0UM90_REHGL